MKSIKILFLLAAVLFVSACSKENLELIKVYDNPGALPGKWKLYAMMADPGNGTTEWKQVPQEPKRYLVFETDGKLSGELAGDYTRYVVQDSVILKFLKADGVTYQNHSYKLQGEILTMGLAGPIYCIEACGTRLKKE